MEASPTPSNKGTRQSYQHIRDVMLMIVNYRLCNALLHLQAFGRTYAIRPGISPSLAAISQYPYMMLQRLY